MKFGTTVVVDSAVVNGRMYVVLKFCMFNLNPIDKLAFAIEMYQTSLNLNKVE